MCSQVVFTLHFDTAFTASLRLASPPRRFDTAKRSLHRSCVCMRWHLRSESLRHEHKAQMSTTDHPFWAFVVSHLSITGRRGQRRRWRFASFWMVVAEKIGIFVQETCSTSTSNTKFCVKIHSKNTQHHVWSLRCSTHEHLTLSNEKPHTPLILLTDITPTI